MSKDFYNKVYQADHPLQYVSGEDGSPNEAPCL